MTDAPAWLRRHPEGVVFILGTLLFAGGLIAVVKRQLSPEPASVGGRLQPSVASSRARVGPRRDEALKPYIDKKKSVLAARASREPRKTSVGIVVFDSYRKALEVAGSIDSESLKVLSLHVRVPLPGFKVEEIELRGRSIAAAAGDFTGPARIAAFSEEMTRLRSVASSVRDPAFKRVYLEDAEALQKAIELLKSGGATIFAVVAEGTHGAFARVASRTGVRLVDLPDDPAATTATHDFEAIWPEDTATARFAGQ